MCVIQNIFKKFYIAITLFPLCFLHVKPLVLGHNDTPFAISNPILLHIYWSNFPNWSKSFSLLEESLYICISSCILEICGMKDCCASSWKLLVLAFLSPRHFFVHEEMAFFKVFHVHSSVALFWNFVFRSISSTILIYIVLFKRLSTTTIVFH